MQEQTVFYVAPNGNDAWSGKLAQPNSTLSDGPFATLNRARQAVRETKIQEPGPITVMLRSGKYYLEDTFILTAEDSGTLDAPITWQAFPGEKPVLSGGKQVTGWKPFQDGIWQCELPGSKCGKWKFRQLFYQGKRQTQARWPKLDPQVPLLGGWAFMERPAWPESTTAFRYPPGIFPHPWAKPSELEVIYYTGGGAFAPGVWPNRVPVKSVDEDQRTITLVHSGLQFDVSPWYQTIPLNAGDRFYVLNGLEDLTQPGEWCFVSEEGLLYFWFPEENSQHAGVVVPYLDCLIDLFKVSWVNLVGLTFTETLDGDNFHHEGVEGAGAMYPHLGWRYCGDAVHLKNTSHCSIQRCTFDAVGGNGIYLEGENTRNTIDYNEFSQAGANAICLLGTRLKHPAFNRVTDNNIHDCGVINKYTAGIFLGMSDGNIVSHNQLTHLPHHAINLSNSPFGRNVVEYNDIHFADQVINDSAAINCWMEEPQDRNIQRCGHIIRFNYIADTGAHIMFDGQLIRDKVFSSGIYLDNYASNCLVYGNIIVRTAKYGILIHAGKNNFVENNIIVDCRYGFRLQDYLSGGVWEPMAGFMTGNHFIHNIIYSRLPDSKPISLYNWTDRTLAQCDENLYFMADGIYMLIDENVRFDGPGRTNPVIELHPFSFERWLSLGYDQQSILIDPIFRDADKDDYRLNPDSPIFNLGFTQIDVDRIGIRKILS